MTRDQIIAKLRELKPQLERDSHVSAIAIFGSYARDEAHPGSDIDVIVEFSETPGLFEFVALQDRLSELLKRKVDLFTKRSLHPALREQILAETIYA
jgi:uncharacterized protein